MAFWIFKENSFYAQMFKICSSHFPESLPIDKCKSDSFGSCKENSYFAQNGLSGSNFPLNSFSAFF